MEFIPPSFKRPDALDEMASWVRTLPIDPQDKKRLLLDWSALTGVHLSAEQIRAIIPELRPDEGEAP